VPPPAPRAAPHALPPTRQAGCTTISRQNRTSANLRPADDSGRPTSTEAGRRYKRRPGRRRRDGASWLALMNIGSGRYVPFSEDPPGQPVALECPECPRGGVRPAAEFVRQFCFRRQPGPRRVFAAPDPPREHRVNVLVGPRVLPRIIHDQSHGQCNDPSPADSLCSIWNIRTWPRQRMSTRGWVTTSPGRRQKRTFVPKASMCKHAASLTAYRTTARTMRLAAKELLITTRRSPPGMPTAMLVRSVTAAQRGVVCASYAAACCVRVSICSQSGPMPPTEAPTTTKGYLSPDYARRVAENGTSRTAGLAVGVQRQEI
jgi:hypothetical protein